MDRQPTAGDVVRRAGEPQLTFTLTGRVADSTSAADRSAAARARLAERWPATRFAVRTVASRHTEISWTDGPADAAVARELTGLFVPAGMGRKAATGSVRLQREVSATAYAVAQLLVTYTTGLPATPDVQRTARRRDPDQHARHLLARQVLGALYVGDHTESALHVDASLFDTAHRLAPLLLALACDTPVAGDVLLAETGDWLLRNGVATLAALDPATATAGRP